MRFLGNLRGDHRIWWRNFKISANYPHCWGHHGKSQRTSKLPDCENEIDGITGAFIKVRYTEHPVTEDQINMTRKLMAQIQASIRKQKDHLNYLFGYVEIGEYFQRFPANLVGCHNASAHSMKFWIRANDPKPGFSNMLRVL